MTRESHCVDVVNTLSVRAESGTLLAGPIVTFHGRNSAGTPITVHVRFPLWLWPLLVKGFARVWLNARALRLGEVAEIDKTLMREVA